MRGLSGNLVKPADTPSPQEAASHIPPECGQRVLTAKRFAGDASVLGMTTTKEATAMRNMRNVVATASIAACLLFGCDHKPTAPPPEQFPSSVFVWSADTTGCDSTTIADDRECDCNIHCSTLMPQIKKIKVTRMAGGLRFDADDPSGGVDLDLYPDQWSIYIVFTQDNSVHRSMWVSSVTESWRVDRADSNSFIGHGGVDGTYVMVPLHITSSHFDFTIPYSLIGEAGHYEWELGYHVREPQGPYSPWTFRGTLNIGGNAVGAADQGLGRRAEPLHDVFEGRVPNR